MAEITVVKSETLSDKYGDRYIVVDEETGEILDDAQGYGYRTPKKAYAALAWKASGKLDKPKTAEDKRRERKQAKERKRERIRDWLKKHSFFTSKIYDFVEMTLKEENDPEIDFNAGEVMFVYKQNLITAASDTIEKEGD